MGGHSPDESLFECVLKHGWDAIKHFLERGGDVNERLGPQQQTLLHQAVKLGDSRVIQALLKRGIDFQATDANAMTALDQALAEGKGSIARRLARHCQFADKAGYKGLTPLQAAIKRGALSVASELLAKGADLTTPSSDGRIAKDFVPEGGSEEYLLLTLMQTYSSLESAIRAENGDAVRSILRKSLSKEDTSAMQDQYATLKSAGERSKWLFPLNYTRNPPERDYAIPNITQRFEMDMLYRLLELGDVGALKTFLDAVDRPGWFANVRFSPDGSPSDALADFDTLAVYPEGWTALHVAASLGWSRLASYLVLQWGFDPDAPDCDGKSAVGLRVEGGDGGRDQVCRAMLGAVKKRRFVEASAKIFSDQKEEPPVTTELRQLLGNLSSVYDLRVLFSLSFRTLSPQEMRELLLDAFAEVVHEELVRDATTATFFDMFLAQCERRGYISKAEKMRWHNETLESKVANLKCVRENQQSIQDLERRASGSEGSESGDNSLFALQSDFSRLRDAVDEKDGIKLSQFGSASLVALVASALVFFGGPILGGTVVGGAIASLVEMAAPAQLLKVLASHGLPEFLEGKATKLVFKDGVKELLSKASIEPDEFANVLRKVIQLDRERGRADVDVDSLLDTESEGDGSSRTGSDTNHRNNVETPEPLVGTTMLEREARNLELLGGSESGLDLALGFPCTTAPLALVDRTRLLDEDLMAHPYHLAVHRSEADIALFLRIQKRIQQDEDCDINVKMTIHVPVTDAGGPFEEKASSWQSVDASAVVFASYLGYADIVDWFLDRDDLDRSEEKPYVTMARALDNEKHRLASKPSVAV